MAYQPETPGEWPANVYQIAVTDPVLGGGDGAPNIVALALARRALYQRLRSVTIWDAALAATFGYPAGACVRHGVTTWRAILDNNVAPGTDPLKWERWGYSESELSAAVAGANANLSEVVNNTYIGPTPTRLSVFTPGPTVADVGFGTPSDIQTITFTGARRLSVRAGLAMNNQSSTTSVNLTVWFELNGSKTPFNNHYLGAVLIPKSGSNLSQIPMTLTDIALGLAPASTYTLKLRAAKQQAIGPLAIVDAFMEAEFV